VNADLAPLGRSGYAFPRERFLRRQSGRTLRGIVHRTLLTTVVALGLAATCVFTAGPSSSAAPVAAGPTVEFRPGSQPPAGMRWVGYGHEAIAVSVGWGTNVTRCGRPQRDTVLIDRGTVPACYAPRRGGVESVEVTRGRRPFGHLPADPITIDGVRAQRRVTTCRTFGPSGGTGSPGEVLCSGSVYFPRDRVGFKVESTVGPVGVDELLARVHHLPALVGVPASRELFVREQKHSGAAYLRALHENGLRAEVIRCRECGLARGYVLGTKPAAGTMRRPGSRVIVVISAPAR